MRDIALTLFLFGGVIPAMRWPWVGVALFTWVSMMNPHRLTWSFAYNMPFAMLIGVATLIGWLASRDSKRLPRSTPTTLFLVFAVWISLTTIFALSSSAVPAWIQTMKIFLMVLVTMTVLTEKKRIVVLVAVVTGSIAFFGIKGGTFTLLGGGVGLVWGPAGSFIEDNNALALALVMTLPLLRFLHAISQKAWLRWGLVVSMGLVLASAIGSQSRGGFLAAAAMVMFLVLKSRQKVAVGLVGIAFVGLVIGFAPASWVERMNTIESYEEDTSAQGRLEAWGFAFDIAKDRPLGGGFRVHENESVYYSYVPDSPKVRAPHSIYFEVLGYHGFIGLGLFLALFIAVYRMAGATAREARGKPELYWAAEFGAMIQVSLVGYAVGGAFQNLAFYDLPYYLMALTVCTHVIVKRTLAERGVAATGQAAAHAAPAAFGGGAYGPR